MNGESSTNSGPLGQIFQLKCSSQSYDWGIKANQGSLVAKFIGKDDQGEEKFAELWMGTHPSLPSHLASNPSSSSSSSTSSSTSTPTLSSYLNSNPSLLGSSVLKRYGTGIQEASDFSTNGTERRESKQREKDTGALPFLFKILSVGKALSIQAHPDKLLAEELHRKMPDVYKDDNHKPEMAIALTPFEAFCGFRPLSEISKFLKDVPEFQSLLFESSEEALKISERLERMESSSKEAKSLLKEVFSRLMKADEKKVERKLKDLCSRYSSFKLQSNGSSNGISNQFEISQELVELVLRLNEQYPGDIGIFCTFLLSHLKLSPGEAIFLGANEPHAYLSGDAVECMAASDNVVRAGLTPKRRDVEVLVDMLTYDHRESGNRRMKASKFGSENSWLYDPPIEEFSVVRSEIKGGEEEKMREVQGPSVLIVTKGEGKIDGLEMGLRTGSVWFVAAGKEVVFQAGKEGLELFRAFVEV